MKLVKLQLVSKNSMAEVQVIGFLTIPHLYFCQLLPVESNKIQKLEIIYASENDEAACVRKSPDYQMTQLRNDPIVLKHKKRNYQILSIFKNIFQLESSFPIHIY